MTAVAEASDTSLFRSDRRLLPFQVEDVIKALGQPSTLNVSDCGAGKSVMAIATIAALLEEDLIDQAFVVCEANKITEWVADLAKFSHLRAKAYRSDPAGRRKMAEDPDIQVLVGSYETVRNDAVILEKTKGKRTKKAGNHFLTKALYRKRMLMIYDEVTRLGGDRTSQTYKAHHHLAAQLRKAKVKPLMLGLTATPIEKSPENMFNAGRILVPDLVGTVGAFEANYVAWKDQFGNAARFKNLTSKDCDPGVKPFRSIFEPIMVRRRKTDPELIDQFPSSTEEFTHITLGERQQDFYEAVSQAFDTDDPEIEILLLGTLRQIVAHPMSILHSKSPVSKSVVEQVGADGLAKIRSAKTDHLVEYLDLIVNAQNDQAVVFTFFGPSVIPLLAEALRKQGIPTAQYHGGVERKVREQNMAAFRAGDVPVLLSSDAGARGINLPEASYAIEYELAANQAMRTQRLNRISRIDSTHPSVSFMSYVALDTVEEGLETKVMQTNRWLEDVVEGEDRPEAYISAADRKALLRISRRKAKRSA